MSWFGFILSPFIQNKWMKRWMKRFMSNSDSLKKIYIGFNLFVFRGPFIVQMLHIPALLVLPGRHLVKLKVISIARNRFWQWVQYYHDLRAFISDDEHLAICDNLTKLGKGFRALISTCVLKIGISLSEALDNLHVRKALHRSVACEADTVSYVEKRII